MTFDFEEIAIHDVEKDTEVRLPHRDPSNPFSFTVQQLISLVDKKDVNFLAAMDGMDGLANGLHSSLVHGLSYVGAQRELIFGTNRLPDLHSKNLLQLMWAAFQDKTLILLTVAAIISLVMGIYEDTTSVAFDANGRRIPGVKWVEGIAIIAAVALVVIVGSVNDYQKEKQFRKLNAKKEDRLVNAIRSGQPCLISIHDIQVGDVLSLEPGDIVPADGVFIQGHGTKCDESAATGESDAVRKAHWQLCCDDFMILRADDAKNDKSVSLAQTHAHHEPHRPDPFMISGSKVLEGICTYMVTAVGPHSFHGRTLMALRVQSEMTPLQEKLNDLAAYIAKLGVAAAGLLFMLLSIRAVFDFLADPSEPPVTQMVDQLTHILITTVTVVVVAVPEGLPLAVTLALAYATQRMLKEHNLVRILAACETMGNATTICSDKTGTLTQNKMTVVAGTLGSSFRFQKEAPGYRADLVDMSAVRCRLPLPVRCFVNQAVAVNSTAFRLSTTLVGNKTETALLTFSRDQLDSEPFECLRACWPVVRVYPFDSRAKCMATVIRVGDTWRVHVKGAPEVLLAQCTHLLSMHDASYHQGEAADRYAVQTRAMTEHNYQRLAKILQNYGSKSLRTIVLAYKDFSFEPDQSLLLEELVQEGSFTFIGMLAIEDPLRAGVKQAVQDCQSAGVCVRMVTGDNMVTAKTIARKCGIYQYGDLAMDGASFRRLSPDLRASLLPHLRVLARCTPDDKRLLIQVLKEHGDIVAVTGDGTNDAPALKAAHVSFSMGQSGTEVAKEASSILLMNDNFANIVHAIAWGRCVNDSVKKFLQFQLTVNITAVLLTMLSALISHDQASILTAVQLLWVNLIMDTFAALALATDPPTPHLLHRQPEPRSAPLITPTMWKMILGQALYQMILIPTLLYTNWLLPSLHDDPATLQTIVFTTFVFCQIFNELNCRRIDNEFNILEGLLRNRFFMVIIVICVVGQVVIVQLGGSAFQTVPLSQAHWALCVGLGFFAIPIGSLIRMVPDDVLFRCRNAANTQALSLPLFYTRVSLDSV
ncbi:PMCA-type calcium-translocating P-type ATPase [Gongronella butleri]|nr:PMCA-type calcium-translocating P-type ATPase [Gongronella butleri]